MKTIIIFILIGLTILSNYPFAIAQFNEDCYNKDIWIFYQLEYALACMENRLDNLENNQKTISDNVKVSIVDMEKEIQPLTVEECELKGYLLVYNEPDLNPVCILPNGETIGVSLK